MIFVLSLAQVIYGLVLLLGMDADCGIIVGMDTMETFVVFVVAITACVLLFGLLVNVLISAPLWLLCRIVRNRQQYQDSIAQHSIQVEMANDGGYQVME
ncbi:MAG: hypothetical protein JOZ57_06005 [Abitibacteriaceae bacterium]|nr:hypothetical protein [Abditibacteriaceae bacterium]